MFKRFLFLLATVTLTSSCLAWEPTRPITVYIGYAAGSGNEISFRTAAAHVEKNNPNAKFVVVNMPGQDGTISLNHSTKLPADGYSINIPAYIGSYAINDILTPDVVKYTQKDLMPVMSLSTSPQVIIARLDSQVNTPRELLAYWKNPNKPVNMGVVVSAHFLLYQSLLDQSQGDREKIKLVPYKGPTLVAADVAGGHIEFGTLPLAIAAPLVNAGKVKLIAVTGTKRPPQFPNVPLLEETVPGTGANMAIWGINLVPGTPPEVVDWYVKNFGKALESEEVNKIYYDNYMTVANDRNPAQTVKVIENMRTRYRPMAEKIKQYWGQ
jgi:hypothetical protein